MEMEMATYFAFLGFDGEAKVWLTEASTIPGLTAENEDLGELIRRVEDLTPVLLRENLYRDYPVPDRVDVRLLAHVDSKVVDYRTLTVSLRM
jgi:hypothetical protein